MCYWIGGSKVEKVLFQAVLVIWPTWVQISTPTAAVQEVQLWSEIVMNRDGVEHENESVKL